VLGIDANAAGMADVASRAARRQERGGAPNAEFIVAAAEALPDQLAAAADLVTVQFPWGSLLRGIVEAEPAIVAPLVGLLRPARDAELRLLLSVEPRDRSLGLEPLDATAMDRLAAQYEAHGLEAVRVGPATAQELAASHSTWAKRLGAAGARRTAWSLRFVRR
jgi:16S rRNA (adenine(1408)-N(1))-methyltransferase